MYIQNCWLCYTAPSDICSVYFSHEARSGVQLHCVFLSALVENKADALCQLDSHWTEPRLGEQKHNRL